MPTIRTILWDVGGVLLTNGWDHREREVVFRHFDLDRGPFEERHPEVNDEWEKGLISVEEYLRRTLFFEPRSFSMEDFIRAMKAQSKVLENTALPVLQRLAGDASLTLGMLNNEARELNDYRIDKFELRKYFRVFLSSCYIGRRKPDAKIYALALDVLKSAPAETVFVDDRAANVEAAAQLGINAIRYTGPAELVNELKRLGVSAA